VTALIAALGGVRASVFAALAVLAWSVAVFVSFQNIAQRASHAEYRAEVAKDKENAATALADAIADVREKDAGAQRQVAELDARYQQEIEDAKANADRTIAALRDGTLVLRKRLAATGCSSRPENTAPSSGSNDQEGSGLREEDVRFLVLESQRADQHTRQLTACQAYIDALSKPER